MSLTITVAIDVGLDVYTVRHRVRVRVSGKCVSGATSLRTRSPESPRTMTDAETTYGREPSGEYLSTVTRKV